MLGFLIITLIFLGALVGLSKMSDLDKVKNEWDKYRCRPDVMVMADYYGHDSTENLEFCLKSGFDKRARDAIGPFYTYLEKFVEVLVMMLGSINSIRMIFATIVGSATQIFSEFSGRIQALFQRFQMAAIRMKLLMGRVFATMYAIIFMGMAGIKAGQNFGNTFLFKFLDTFCFDPDTLIKFKTGQEVPIKDVKVGDVLKGGQRVTASFQFVADGQEMVLLLGNITVSTNHYIKYKDSWILSKDHPDAIPTEEWSGGTERPLICLNTDTHEIPIDDYIFNDYDETSEGDAEAMKMATDILNGKEGELNIPDSSEMACHGKTFILTKNGVIPASDITLGTELSLGTVTGIVKKECSRICEINGEIFASGTCVWSKDSWMRAYQVSEVKKCEATVLYSFVVSPSACIETSFGTVFRDYVEVHSKDMEAPYSSRLNKN
jgi:hypothetical protein